MIISGAEREARLNLTRPGCDARDAVFGVRGLVTVERPDASASNGAFTARASGRTPA